MTALPNRISAFGPLSPARESALARQLLEIQSEEELDHFLPLIAAAAPMIANIAGPLLKNLAGGLFGGGGGGRKRRARDQQEYFFGKVVRGLLGEAETESEEEEQFLGGIIKGLLGGRELEAEQQQFLGGIIGKLFGGRELEAESYVQEQFLGGIIGKLFGGRELEAEASETAGPDPARLMRRARRFVQLVHAASGHAAGVISNLQRAGRRPSPFELRRIVLCSLVAAARRFAPRLAAAAFPAGAGASAGAGPAAAGHAEGPHAPAGAAPQSMLEMMIAEATPLGVRPPLRNGAGNPSGYPLG